MALEAVILDVDGTLLDANHQHARSWEEALHGFGYALPAGRILFEIGKSGDRLVEELLGEDVEKEQGQELRDAHGEVYQALIEDEGVAVFDGVEELFRELRQRDLRIAIATASSEDDFAKKLEQAGLDLRELADVTVTDSDVEEGKPHPDTVAAAVKKLGVAPTECVMVGDTPYDAIASRRAGVACIGVLPEPHNLAAMHEAGARVTYPDLPNLVEHLDEALRLASPGETAFSSEQLSDLMGEALQEARQALSQGDLPVGALLVSEKGAITARGRSTARSRGSAIAHAEINVLTQLSTDDVGASEGRVLVTTLEPCVMCFGAAMEAQIDTIIYALAAPPNGGTERCVPPETSRMPRVVGGIREEESRKLLQEWLAKYPEDGQVKNIVEAG